MCRSDLGINGSFNERNGNGAGRWSDAQIQEPGIRVFWVNKDKNVELITTAEARGFRLMFFMADLQHVAQTRSHLIMRLF